MSWLRRPDRSDRAAYAEYLEQGLLKPRKAKNHFDPVEEFQVDWIRHLEERLVEAMIGRERILGETAPSTIVAWMARKDYRIPARVVADFYGYTSAASVRTVSNRIEQRVREEPYFRTAIETVIEIATRKR